MNKNELLKIKEQLEAEYNSTLEEFYEFFIRTDYYGEYCEGNIEKEAVIKHLEDDDFGDDFDELFFYNGEEQRQYDNYQNRLNIFSCLYQIIDEIIISGQKAKTNNGWKENLEKAEFFLDVYKEVSERIIEREKALIESCTKGLKIIDEIRKD